METTEESTPSSTASTALAQTQHQFLAALIGEWKGTTRTWFEPDVLGDESQWTGTIRPVLGGLYLVHEYSGSLCGEVLIGMALIGYSTFYKRYEMAWIDNNHSANAMMFATSSVGDKLAVLGSCPGYEVGADWGWRTEFELRDADTLVITAYNISPQGEEAKAIETVYHRTLQ